LRGFDVEVSRPTAAASRESRRDSSASSGFADYANPPAEGGGNVRLVGLRRKRATVGRRIIEEESSSDPNSTTPLAASERGKAGMGRRARDRTVHEKR